MLLTFLLHCSKVTSNHYWRSVSFVWDVIVASLVNSQVVCSHSLYILEQITHCSRRLFRILATHFPNHKQCRASSHHRPFGEIRANHAHDSRRNHRCWASPNGHWLQWDHYSGTSIFVAPHYCTRHYCHWSWIVRRWIQWCLGMLVLGTDAIVYHYSIFSVFERNIVGRNQMVFSFPRCSCHICYLEPWSHFDCFRCLG